MTLRQKKPASSRPIVRLSQTGAATLTLGLLLSCLPATGQKGVWVFNENVAPVLDQQGSVHGLFKATLVFGIEKGASIAIGHGL